MPIEDEPSSDATALSPEEIARRRDETIKAMIATPPKPRNENPPPAAKKRKRAKAKA